MGDSDAKAGKPFKQRKSFGEKKSMISYVPLGMHFSTPAISYLILSRPSLFLCSLHVTAQS